MIDPRLFRVFEVSSEDIKVNPILEGDNRFVDDEDTPLIIDIGDLDASLEQTVSLLEPGHVIKAEVNESDGTYRFNSIEHRGGFTLVKLDSRNVPYMIDEYLDSIGSPEKDEITDNSFTVSLDKVQDGSQGELFVQYSSELDNGAWNDFCCGVGSEAVYGGFHMTSGKPAEVFIGNPEGEGYWFALLFPEEGSPVARRIRAQYGYLYDDHYLPNPAWDLSGLIDTEKLPEDPDNSPKDVFRPEHNVHSSLIPTRFGSDTIDLLAEFVYVGSQFEISMLGDSSDSLDPSQPLTYKPDELPMQNSPLIHIYKFYTSLLTDIYDCVQENPHKDIEVLVEDGTLPEPELLYRTQILFASSIHGVESYLQKMEQVPIEEYVVSRLQGRLKPEVQEIMDEFDLEGFPLTIRYLLRDWGFLLEDVKEIINIATYIADIDKTESGLVYDIQAEEKAYNFINQHQDRMSDQITPADLGGQDPAVFMPLLGRLEQRHDWLITSSMGPMGGIFDSLKEELG